MPGEDGGGGFGAALPPVSGLGNFKGVMLCNRPSDSTNSGGAYAPGEGPFKSAVSGTHNEQLGLNPVRKTDGEQQVKTRGPSAALRRHVKWLKELQGQMREERDQVEDEVRDEEEKRQRMKAAVEKHREGVQRMKQERDAAEREEEGGAQRRPDNSTQKKGGKPMWAMTAKEKDDFEEEEADDLINFANNLDYDKFIGNLEFRQGVAALQDRAGKLQKEQDAFKDALVKDFNATALEDDEATTSAGSPRSLRQLEDGVDGVSLLGSEACGSESSEARRERRAQERVEKASDWDNSTACGDDEQRIARREAKDAAERVLESNSQIRAVHSKASVARIVEKAKAKAVPLEPIDLVEHMRREGAAPVPVITASADTQAKLHKPVDPSQLPYLYRSPAV